MTTPRRLSTLAATAALVALVVVGASAGIKVQADFSPTFDFTTLHTWGWNPNGVGNAVRIISAEEDSTEIKQQFQQRILPIVEAEFVRRKFAKAAVSDADFYVTCYVLVTVGDSSQTMGQFLAPVPMWGLPPFAPSTNSLTVFPRGSLILDIAPRAIGEVAWRGTAQADLKWEESQSDKEQRVRDAVRQLLTKFPPKPGKK